MKKIFILLLFGFNLAMAGVEVSLRDRDIYVDEKSGLSEAVVREILAIRHQKNPDEVWKVDLSKGNVRIRKRYKNGGSPPPGAAVEFWYKDAAGKWKARLTV